MIPAGPSDRRDPVTGAPGAGTPGPVRLAGPILTTTTALAAALAATTIMSGGPPLLAARAVVLVVLVLSVATVVGVLVVVLLLLPGGDVRRSRLLDAAAVAAGLWAVSAATTALLLYLGEAPPAASPSFGPGLVSFVTDIAIGRTWVVAAVAAAALSALLIAVRSTSGVLLLLLLAVVAAVPVALQSATPGQPIPAERTVVGLGLVQLTALGAWTGGLAIGAAVRGPVRRLPAVGCLLALLVATAAAWPALTADGGGSPVAVAGAVAVGLAGVLAVLGARRGRAERSGAQLALLGLGIGLAAAASVTHAVPDLPDRVAPAEILTGSPLPPVPTLMALLGAWQADPLWLVACGALLLGYGRIALRTPGWPAPRSCSWLVGVLLLAWLTCGPAAVYQEVLLGAHLLQHAALLLVVPLLLAGGAPKRLLAAAEASARPGSVDRLRRGVLAVLDSRALGVVARPVPAMLGVVAVMAVLYGSGALRWSVADPVGTEVVALATLLIGAVLVRALTSRGRHRRSAAIAAGVLLVVETCGALVLALGSSLLLPDWFGAMGWGTDALAAQRSSALSVWAVAALPTLVLLTRALRTSGAERSTLARPEAATT